MSENKEIIRQAYIDTLKDLFGKWQELKVRSVQSCAIDDNGELCLINNNVNVFEINNAYAEFVKAYDAFQEWRRAG